jgi:hypothetical protein
VADNVSLPLTGAGGTTATVATDEVSSAHYQYVKPAFGADGTATPVSSANPLPVTTQPTNIATANVTGAVDSVTTGAAVTVLAAFATRRKGMVIPTDGDVYMSLTGTADASSGIVPAGTPINLDGFSGAVSMLGKDGTVVVSKWEY